MNVFRDIEQFPTPRRGCVATIGNFDGVHRGHQRLLFSLRRLADEFSVPAVAITFEPHPLTILAPGRAPERLTTLAEKLALLERAKLDSVIIVRSEPRFFALSPDEFVNNLVQFCRPIAIVEGQRFNYGRGRAGTLETLRAAGERRGFAVRPLDTIRCDDLPGTPEVSSSAIRGALSSGDVTLAAKMLGRPHRVTGRVVAGDGRGITIGFPTANLDDIPQMLPVFGVYAAVAQLSDGRFLPAAVNVGPQPTFSQLTPRVEAHLIDFCEDLRDQPLGLHWVARIRDQVRFQSIDQLVRQLAEDVAGSRTLIASAPQEIVPDAIPLDPH